MTLDELERELAELLKGLTPLEKALRLAPVFREVWGEQWTIEARADGGFSLVWSRHAAGQVDE